MRFRGEDHLVAQADGFRLGRKREREQEPNRKPGERTGRGTSGLHGFTVAQNCRWTRGAGESGVWRTAGPMIVGFAMVVYDG